MFDKVVTYLGTKIAAVIDYLTLAITDPKKLLATSFAIGASVDALLVGKLGFIAFIFAQLGFLSSFIVAGGWPLVVVVLVVALAFSKK